MRTNKELLIILRDYLEAHYRAERLLYGLCNIFDRMVIDDIMEEDEMDRLELYLRARYAKRLAYWWPAGDYQSRYNAICECINIEELKEGESKCL